MTYLEAIYKRIPSFVCAPGCNACCGPVPCNEEEQAKLKIITDITPTKLDNITCAYSTDKGCSVYEDRPYMCRLFGVTDSLRCPMGRGPEVMLTVKEENKLMAKYIKTMEL